MSRISKVFEKEKAFIAFITGGDPDMETSYELVKAMAANGAVQQIDPYKVFHNEY